MKNKAYLVIKVLVSVYTVLCIALYYLQDSLIYYPQERRVTSPKSTLHLKTQDADIVITTMSRPGNKAIIYFGGNGEDVSLSLSDFEDVFPGYSLYFMHYRGYGGSTGSPSEENNHKDAVALYKMVRQNHKNISIIGRSLGTGVAVHLASEMPVSNLVLVTPYDSIENIAEKRFPFFPVSLLLHEKYRSWLYAKNVTAPTTIIMAGNDKVIPRDSTTRLYGNFRKGIAKLVLIKGVGHNSISLSNSYYPLLKSAIKLLGAS